jgi:hypothetical protein
MRTLGLALAVVLLWAGGAQARREQTYAYPFSRVWTAAIRMLRVDFESPITEKDKDSGYFLFDFPDGSKSHAGSVELVRVQHAGVENVRVVLQVPALPSYVEQMLLDHLARKLGQDYGQPPAPKPEEVDTTPVAPSDQAAPQPSESGERSTKKPAAKPEAGAAPESSGSGK